MRFIITDAQAGALVEAIQDYRSGDEIEVTVYGDGSLAVQFGLATATIPTDGDREDS
jgi:hypothetical protein